MEDPKKLKALIAKDQASKKAEAAAIALRAPQVAAIRRKTLADATVFEANRNVGALAALVEKLLLVATLAPELHALAEEVRTIEFKVMRRIRDEQLGNHADEVARI